MASFYSPLRYPGGKNCNFSFVSELIRENELIGCTYIEPYAGGAGLALRLLYEEYVQNIVLNDYDPLVYSFWKTCKFKPDALVSWIEAIKINMENWNKYKEVILHQDKYDEFELATAFLFLNRTNVSGILSGGVIGGKRQEGKYKIDARFNKKTIIERVIKFSKFASRIEVTNFDSVNYLKNIDTSLNNSFIYLDPPYYEKGSNLYLNFYTEDDHNQLASLIPMIKCHWLLSYDNCSFIRNLYNDFDVYSYDLNHSTSNKVGKELIILDQNLDKRESLKLLRNHERIEPLAMGI